MRRFYRTAETVPAEDGWLIALDGRPVRTPRRSRMIAPTEALALAIAAEWQAQEGEIRPDAMPLTRLANAALDLLPGRRAEAVATIAAFAETDLVCYRAEQPVELVRRQELAWQPLLDWLEADRGARLLITRGLAPVRQPVDACARLRARIEALPDWPLVGVHAATTALGSVVLALALRAGRVGAEEALRLSLLDELFEIERWGEEREQQRRHRALHAEVEAAARFLALLGPA